MLTPPLAPRDSRQIDLGFLGPDSHAPADVARRPCRHDRSRVPARLAGPVLELAGQVLLGEPSSTDKASTHHWDELRMKSLARVGESDAAQEITGGEAPIRTTVRHGGFFAYHGIWAPGVRLFRNLNFAAKALSIPTAFLVPMVGLADILAQVDVALGLSVKQKGLRLQIESPPSLLTQGFNGDALRIEQILANLVGNAIKFTDRGSIWIRLSSRPTADTQTMVRIEVSDTGMGIAQEDQSRIFSNFEQVDASLARAHQGAGLGLALCAKLAPLLGGRIGVHSVLEKGSCFWLELPLQGGPLAPDAAAGHEVVGCLRSAFAGMRALVVEDNTVSAEVTRLLLEDVDMAVDWAPSGAVAIEHVAVRPYALIIMDLQMPEMDGLTAIRAIRALPHGRSNPIVALTARILDLDRLDCAGAGIDDIVAKPVDAAQFYSRVLTALTQSGRSIGQ